MSANTGQILTLLTVPPGNLIYHLILVIPIVGTLIGVIQYWRSSQFLCLRRTIFGLSLLLSFQLLQFTLSLLTWQGLLDSQIIMPPLDRALVFLGLVWITWLWVYLEPAPKVDIIVVLINLLAVVLFSLSLLLWIHNGEKTNFNQSFFKTIWESICLAVAIMGAVAMIIRKPSGWYNGLLMMVVASVGLIVSLFSSVEGNYSGIVRLTQIAFYPVLLSLPKHLQNITKPLTKYSAAAIPIIDQLFHERQRFNADSKTLKALLTLAGATNITEILHSITRSVAQVMLADLCFLIFYDEEKRLFIVCGYDLIREEYICGSHVDANMIPMLANAIKRGRPLRLSAGSASSEFKGLGKLLGLNNPGHLLNVPITANERKPLGSLLILSPYSNRMWSLEDQTYLSGVSSLFVPIIKRGSNASTLENILDQTHEDTQPVIKMLQEFQKQHDDLYKKAKSTTIQETRSNFKVDTRAALSTKKKESKKLVEQLKYENEQLRKIGKKDGVSTDSSYLEHELHLSLEEVARLQNFLAEANIKIIELGKRPISPISSDQIEVINYISQELRQPMSSIIGYTDLLLSESIGTLGTMQHKFIERIKSSIDRVGGLMEDLIRVTTLETNHFELKSKETDLNLIIENAMVYTNNQIHKNNINIRLDVPISPPRIQADREALQQILIHLLQNASAASPIEGTITLRVRIKKENKQDYILFQVTDSGCGIAQEDIKNVFSPRYNIENLRIKGLGDAGIGLSIAKKLTEAQNGRIWVETEKGSGSTFNVLIPMVLIKDNK